jgi:hypothetical protein
MSIAMVDRFALARNDGGGHDSIDQTTAQSGKAGRLGERVEYGRI